MRKLITILLILGTCFAAGAQNRYGDNWLFGYKCGLNFATNPPQPILESEMISEEGCASISDKQGNLVCYTNGKTVWNKLHQVMDNGDGLAGGSPSPWWGSSSTNGMLILPSITDTNQYLIFTQHLLPDTGIRVSTVDMTYNGGLGKVVSKNQPVYQGIYFTEKFAACRHANGRDWWLVLLEAGFSGPTNRYHVLLYSHQGVQLYHIDTAGLPVGSGGEFTFSKQGNHVGVAGLGRVEILDFDRCSGHLVLNTDFSYAFDQPFNTNEYYGACFSPDESKFYVCAQRGQHILQYSKVGSTGFEAADTIWSDLSIDTNVLGFPCERLFLGQLQLGVDDKIYCSFTPDCTAPTAWNSYSHNVSVINSPNVPGAACDFQPVSVFVGDAPHYLLGGLPNMPNYNLGVLEGSGCDTIHTTITSEIRRPSVNLYPNPTTGNFTLVVDAEEAGRLNIAVTDLLGRVIVEQRLKKGQAVYDVKAGLPSGSYQCIVYNGSYRLRTIPFCVVAR